MKISKINLTNFRNYASSSMSFSEESNIFIGENAQGKTNVLEAVYLIGMAQSFRRAEDQQMIKFQEPWAKIEASISKNLVNKEIGFILYRDQPKTIKVNHKKIIGLANYIGNVNITLFSPEDLMIIKSDASFRRKYIDSILCQTDKIYLKELIFYQKTLKQRNFLLKEIKIGRKNKKNLENWNEQFIQYAAIINEKRSVFLSNINSMIEEIHKKITNNNEKVTLKYRCSFDLNNEKYEEGLRRELQSLEDQEIIRGISLVGPQRDDVEININEINSRYFGSQGQQRTLAISLRMAEVEYIYHKMQEYPVLLLDDIFSELDDRRKNAVMQFLQKKIQMFLTGTRESDFPELIQKAKIFKINQGKSVCSNG